MHLQLHKQERLNRECLTGDIVHKAAAICLGHPTKYHDGACFDFRDRLYKQMYSFKTLTGATSTVLSTYVWTKRYKCRIDPILR